jgi:type II secretory pathway pseudopilin PulG
MNSMKCPQCGLINWATAEACKRCRLPFNGADASGANQWAADDDTYGYEEEPDAQQGASYGYQGEAAHGAWEQQQQSGYYQGGYQSQDAYQGGYQDSSYGYGGYAGHSEAPKQTGIAVGSMVVGIINILACGLLGVGSLTGFILGIVALVKAKNAPHKYGGHGFAVAGIVLSLVSFIFVGIVFSIAIPNVLASRRAANEGAAIRALRTLHSAEMTFQSTAGNGKCGTLQQLAAEGLIDNNLASGLKNNYRFDIRPNGMYFEATATPTSQSDVGSRSFFVNESGVLRGSLKRGMAATAYDPPLAQEDTSPYRQSSPDESYERRSRQTDYSPNY